jgi:hypothetical protein
MPTHPGNSLAPVLAQYSFIPWLRQGISNQITEIDDLGSGNSTLQRATFEVNVKIKEKGGNLLDTVAVDISLVGPGDIIGMNDEAIVKTHPSNWVTNFQPTQLPYIEFYEEDFPWRYTPAIATHDHQLRPWLFLLVLKQDEFVRRDPLAGPLPSLSLTNGASPFPPLDQTWAWAHVHINGNLDELGTLDLTQAADIQTAIQRFNDLVAEYPNLAVSRLVSPRQLEADTEYYAFLVPAFETGRLAGLGQDATGTPAQAAAWGGATPPVDYPFYHEWYFKTGAAGDFEQLVRTLTPRLLDSSVGVQTVDLADPGYTLSYQDGSGPEAGVIGMHSVLRVPGAGVKGYTEDGFISGPWLTFLEKIQDLANLGEDVLMASFNASIDSVNQANQSNLYYLANTFVDDPVVSPPLYGRWHALQRTVDVDSLDWINELNLDPRQRIAAGIGAEIVRRKQDELMEQAWDQLGEVIEANKKIDLAQIAKEIAHRLYQKHFVSLATADVLSISEPINARVRTSGSQEPVLNAIKSSTLPEEVIQGVGRKIRRVRGPLMKRLRKTMASGSSLSTSLEASGFQASKAMVENLSNGTIKLSPNTNTAALQVDIGLPDATTLIGDAINRSVTSGEEFNMVATVSTATTAVSAGDFQAAVLTFSEHFDPTNWTVAAEANPLDLPTLSGDLLGAISPQSLKFSGLFEEVSFRDFNFNRILARPTLSPDPDKIVNIMAHPVYTQPMLEELMTYSPDFLLSNLHLVPQNTIALLETNPKFIESFMLGLNTEMARELLWREYPTDQRGTYFRQFWNVADFIQPDPNLPAHEEEENNFDIDFIHQWPSNTRLGTHNVRWDDGDDADPKVVLMIRGDLFKKYPQATLFAARGAFHEDSPVSPANATKYPTSTVLYPAFSARLEPDVLFLGFDLTINEALGKDANGQYVDPGYFFVIKERSGEVSLGLDFEPQGFDPVNPNPLGSWQDLHWGYFAQSGFMDLSTALTVTDPAIGTQTTVPGLWNMVTNSADVAAILYQTPYMVSMHARAFIPQP